MLGACIAESLKAAARELARYKLDLVGVQEVRWGKGGTVQRWILRKWEGVVGNGWS